MTRGNTLLENISKLNTFIHMIKSNEFLSIYLEKILKLFFENPLTNSTGYAIITPVAKEDRVSGNLRRNGAKDFEKS